MRRFKFVWLAVAVAGLALGLAACGGDDDDDGGPGETQVDLTIGDSLPLSGDLADFGPPGDKAAKLAVSEIKNAIQDAGVDHKVTLVTEDNETNPQAAVQAARKMVTDGATCIAGAWASADTIPTFESVSSREGILQISPASTSDEITGLNDPDGLMNRTAPPDAFQGPTLADYMEEELGGAEGTTVNVGARNDAYGTGLADTFSAAWEEKGGSIGDEVIYDPEQPSYDSEAGQIASGNPDAWVIIDFPETYNKVGPALVRSGDWDPKKTFVTDGLVSGSLGEDAGEDAVEGIRATAPGAPDEGSPTEQFDEAYTQFNPRNVDRQTFDAQNFDAVMLCYLAAVAAGSTEGTDMAEEVREVSGPPGDEYTYLTLSDAITALQDGDDIDYNGASGQIDMDEAGDATAGVYDTYEYRGGVPEVSGELPVAEEVEAEE
ncbi:MAG TPA: ABC transporter substrate-binding protein [Solirubrobacterales bacterium]|nr:ABC transporter substrate-binding protein [Solirubrobacterales bacterium]